MYHKWFLLMCLLLTSTASAVDVDDPRYSCFQISVQVDLTCEYADADRTISARTYGNAFAVDERHLVTCKHVVSIKECLEDAIHNHAKQPASIHKVKEIRYALEARNPFGAEFATVYRPEVRWEADGTTYDLNVNFLDAGTRPDYDRSIALDAEHPTADLTLLRIKSKQTLQPLSLGKLDLILIKPGVKRTRAVVRALACVSTSGTGGMIDVVERPGTLIPGGRVDSNGYTAQVLNMAVWPGDSGAPVVNDDNVAVGVVMATDKPVRKNCRASIVPGDILSRFVFDLLDPVPPAPKSRESDKEKTDTSVAQH